MAKKDSRYRYCFGCDHSSWIKKSDRMCRRYDRRPHKLSWFGWWRPQICLGFISTVAVALTLESLRRYEFWTWDGFLEKLTMETAWNVFLLLIWMAMTIVALVGVVALVVYGFRWAHEFLKTKAEYRLKKLNATEQHKHSQFVEDLERQAKTKQLTEGAVIPNGQWKGEPLPRRKKRKPDEAEVIVAEPVFNLNR